MEHLDERTVKELIQFRRELHRLAEISGREKNTALKVKEFLTEYEPDTVIENVGGYGLIAGWNGSSEGPAVMVRCELDALPIPEENEFDYRSENEGVSHKCGHDGHMAVVAGIAAALKRMKPRRGSVQLLFQPSEETGEGAARVLDDERFNRQEPDYLFALHNLPGYPAGRIITREGIFSSASRGLEVWLKGSTSHAAHPEQGNSPAVALAELIQSFSSFPNEDLPAGELAIVTVVHALVGGIAFGTTPGRAEFRATLRAHDNAVVQKLAERAERIVNETAAGHGLEKEVRWVEEFEATENDEECTVLVRRAARNLGFEIAEKDSPFGWSEDFGRFTSRYKGVMFGIGAGVDHPPLHASNYDFPDKLIPAGTSMFLEVIDSLVDLQSK